MPVATLLVGFCIIRSEWTRSIFPNILALVNERVRQIIPQRPYIPQEPDDFVDIQAKQQHLTIQDCQ